MSLTTLPDELLFQIAEIVSQTAPNDIEDFGRGCRRLRNIAWPLIQEHRKSLHAYTNIHANSAVAADLIFELCRRPWVGVYPKSLEVSANRNLKTLERPKTVKQVAIVDAFKAKRNTVRDEELEETIVRTGLIPHIDVPAWMDGIKRGDEDYLFAILLACLPNLERFVIRLDLEKMEQVKEMVRTIKKEWSQKATLPNLRTVQVRERDGARQGDLEMFPLLAAIPGVTNVHGSVSRLTYCYQALTLIHLTEPFWHVPRMLPRRLALLSWGQCLHHSHSP